MHIAGNYKMLSSRIFQNINYMLIDIFMYWKQYKEHKRYINGVYVSDIFDISRTFECFNT